MSETNEDRLIEVWHELATAVETGTPVDIPKANGILNEVLGTFAPTQPKVLHQAEVLSVIANTRQLEKTWNQRLVRTLNQASDAKSSNDLKTALALLDQFTDQCPWAPFSRVAQDQRIHYAASR